jgi:hypothetical protein
MCFSLSFFFTFVRSFFDLITDRETNILMDTQRLQYRIPTFAINNNYHNYRTFLTHREYFNVRKIIYFPMTNG